MKIRSARFPDDADVICRLMKMLAMEEGGQSQLTKDKLLQQLQINEPILYIVVAETFDQEIIGTAIAYKGYDVLSATQGLHLSDIYVIPDKRCNGVGKKLLAYLSSVNLEKGGQWMSWTVLKSNKKAQKFYRSLGATEIDVDFMAFGVTVLKQIIMEKPIN